MIIKDTKALKWLNLEDKEAVVKALKKLRQEDLKKGKKEGALFKTIHKPSAVGKAGGVTSQGGGTSRGD